MPRNWIVALNVVSVLSGVAAALLLYWGSLGGVGAVVGGDLRGVWLDLVAASTAPNAESERST